MVKNQLITWGNFLFRYRSYIPIPVLFIGLYIYYVSLFNSIDSNFFNYSMMLSLTGLLIRIFVIGYSFERTSGRNTKTQVASKLNTNGIYSVIRHPLYLGNFIIWLGISFLTLNTIFILLSILFYLIIYGIIIFVEEEFLRNKFKKEHEEYSKNIPLIFPNFSRWKPPVESFNLKKVVMNEKNGLLGITSVFYLFNCIDFYKTTGYYYEKNWIFYLSLFSVLFYLSVKIFQKLK